MVVVLGGTPRARPQGGPWGGGLDGRGGVLAHGCGGPTCRAVCWWCASEGYAGEGWEVPTLPPLTLAGTARGMRAVSNSTLGHRHA